MWFENIPQPVNKKELTLEELKKLRALVTTDAAKQGPPCKVCGGVGEFGVVGDGFYCEKDLPGDVQIIRES